MILDLQRAWAVFPGRYPWQPHDGSLAQTKASSAQAAGSPWCVSAGSGPSLPPAESVEAQPGWASLITAGNSALYKGKKQPRRLLMPASVDLFQHGTSFPPPTPLLLSGISVCNKTDNKLDLFLRELKSLSISFFLLRKKCLSFIVSPGVQTDFKVS